MDSNIENIKLWLAESLGTQVFDGEINEYIDWTTGINELTGARISGVDDNTKISGKAIRNLILSKMRQPFVTETDDTDGKIKFFSSEAAKNMWKSFKETFKETGDEEALEKAQALEIYSMDMPATYRITGLESFVGARYIIEGNATSDNAKLDLNLGLEDSLGSPDSDVLTVSYNITDNTGNVLYSSSNLLETNQRLIKDIYDYLRAGDNTVEIVVTANNHSVRTSRTFHIYLVTFSISSDFTGFYSPITAELPFRFNVYINRSITNLPVLTKVYIDGSLITRTDPTLSGEFTTTGSSSTPVVAVDVSNIYLPSEEGIRRKHIMRIVSTMTDSEMGNTFESNTLIYEFEVSPKEDELVYTYINMALSLQSGSYSNPTYTDIDGQSRAFPIIKATQYLPITLNWGYSTDSFSVNREADIEWAIRTGTEGNYFYESLNTIKAVKGEQPEALTFIPSLARSTEENGAFLVARVIKSNTTTDIAIFPIEVEGSSMTVTEANDYSLKLNAYGKTNTSSTRNEWTDVLNNVTTIFSPGVVFDNSNGWNDNSLILKGTASFATINYCPFPNTYNGRAYSIGVDGATFEIDFKPEYVSSTDDILLFIGSFIGSTPNLNQPHIRITANSAGFYTGSAENSAIVKTNYKAGERIKLAFVFNKSNNLNNSNLIYIVNNGILERAGARGTAVLYDEGSRIKIGGSNSSLRVYMIRAYRRDLSPKTLLDNYMFDNPSNVNLISRNDVYGNLSEVTYPGMQGKQDLITIEGDLTNILTNKANKENATVNITRESHLDSARNFTVLKCRIRNHGQSTLSYPITSMKIWFNKSNEFDKETGKIETIPTFSCPQLVYMNLNKNRYVFKKGAIPSNKFVLQANYADSSGTHNGSLLRLINDTWYNAQVNGEFKLRTAPQLFASGASVTHNNTSLNEPAKGSVNEWIEGVYNIDPSSDNYNVNYKDATWPQITSKAFPYEIRVAPDSFPCTVFYRDTSTEDKNLTLLGQYVFMDDKKSDFCFGERSIYYTDDVKDPFCLTIDNAKKDTDANKVWDNSKVLQVEVVYPNSPLTSYNTRNIYSEYNLVEDEETGEETLVPAAGATEQSFDTVTKRDSNNNPTEYLWEQHFELIYPDKDDFTDKNGVFQSQKYANTIRPFEDFIRWITSVADLRNTGSKLGLTGAKKYVTQMELDKFTLEAHDHLDLYKLAAYYIFFSRFGLVDSVERNAQLKTYDGQHWHYEPWDMDIALGCANNGVIAYDPPISRETHRPNSTTYVFAGRTPNQSNVLWDCLESWDYWMETIVPEVAQALYDAGLTYNNAIKMFDLEYVEKWSETLYNESGQYKYIEATNEPKYRRYLNGARTSHRHWWLSKSMNYYDAKWSCGDFKKNTISFRINNNANNLNNIVIYPTQDTFFKVVKGDGNNISDIGGGLKEATIGNGTVMDVTSTLDDKQYNFIYGATSIEKLDMRNLMAGGGSGWVDIDLGGSYDIALGALIKELLVGCPSIIYDSPDATTYTSKISTAGNEISGLLKITDSEGVDTFYDALENLEFLDVIGWNGTQSSAWLSSLMSGTGYDRKNIKTLYAMGCNMATEFSSSNAGNNFIDLRLPDSIVDLIFTNSTWLNLSFWTYSFLSGTATYTKHVSDPIPASVRSVLLKGTTGKNECSLKLVLDWIDAIDASLPVGHTEQDLYDELRTNRTLVVDLAYWGTGTNKLYYRDALRLAKFKGDGSEHPIKGYILLTSDGTNLTVERMSELQSLFGENVFNIGSTSSNLVVDYANDQVIISISGIHNSNEPNPISIITNGNNESEIWLKEPKSARLRANHFTLSLGDTDNQLAGSGVNDPTNINNLVQGKYIWGFVEDPESLIGTTMTVRKGSALLVREESGLIRLKTVEGPGTNSLVHVRVVYGKIEDNQVVAVQNTITVHIEGVTYPDEYRWRVESKTNDTYKTFKCTGSVASTLFGNNIANLLLNAGYPDIYLILKSGAEATNIEFSLYPYPEKSISDGQTIIELWTASTDSQKIYFDISELGNALNPSLNGFPLTENTELLYGAEGIASFNTRTYVTIPKEATNGGICIKADLTLPSTPVLYQLNGEVRIGGKTPYLQRLYFMVLDDADVIITNTLAPLSVAMRAKYQAVHSTAVGDMYRSHLLSLEGTLDFSTAVTGYTPSALASLITNKGDSVLNYIPNVTSINFEGCSSLTLNDVSTGRLNLNFSQCSNLQSINLKDCTSLGTTSATGITVDFSGCTSLTSLDLRGTAAGAILPTNTIISDLKLGSPIELEVNSPTVLGNDGTYSIQGDENWNSITLINVNASNPKGFTLFDQLYNYSVINAEP